MCLYFQTRTNLIGMDQEVRKTMLPSSSAMVDIDQLCQLIDQNKFGLKIYSTGKFSSIPIFQMKIFRSSRLKRLHSSSTIKTNENDSSLLLQFRSLSTTTTTRQLPPNNDDDEKISSQCSTVNSCNVAELTSYFEHFFNLPKALSSAAELMYT